MQDSDIPAGLLTFFGIAAVAAILRHALVPRYLLAYMAITVTTVLAFQVIAFVHLSFLDPFLLIAVATSSSIALMISLLVDIGFQERRKHGAQS